VPGLGPARSSGRTRRSLADAAITQRLEATMAAAAKTGGIRDTTAHATPTTL
jgi:hypothetical protein